MLFSLPSFAHVYRKVEKFELISSSHPPARDCTLAELFIRPFGQVTIQRPLKHFQAQLALTPGVAGEPSIEFLTRLLTGHRSHKSMLRRHLGDGLYRNFENLIRRKNEPTQKTLIALAQLFCSSPEDISGLAHGHKQGPLLPHILQPFQIVEGFFSWVYGKFTAGTISCPCCGENLLDDTDAYWRQQTSIRLDPPEYLFVERCLAALVGWRLFKGLLSAHGLFAKQSFSSFNPDPADPSQYPVGNWLAAVRAAYGSPDNLDLEKHLAALPVGKGPSKLVIRERLNKWACGDEPIDVGKSMVKNLPNADNLRQSLLEACSIAFLQEFVSAAALGADAPTSADVRFIIHERASGLANKLRFNLLQTLWEPLLTANPEETPTIQSMS